MLDRRGGDRPVASLVVRDNGSSGHRETTLESHVPRKIEREARVRQSGIAIYGDGSLVARLVETKRKDQRTEDEAGERRSSESEET